MFWLSILSLILLAGMFHINNRPHHLAVFNGCLLGFLGLYPAYWVDCLWAVRLGSRDGGYHWQSEPKIMKLIIGSGSLGWVGKRLASSWKGEFNRGCRFR